MACQLLPLKPEGSVGLLVSDVWSQTINGYIKFFSRKSQIPLGMRGHHPTKTENIIYHITSTSHVTRHDPTSHVEQKRDPRALFTFQLWFWRVQPVSWNFKFQIHWTHDMRHVLRKLSQGVAPPYPIHSNLIPKRWSWKQKVYLPMPSSLAADWTQD